MAQGHAVYRAEDSACSETVVRHLAGYELFVTMCVEAGRDVEALTSDISLCGSLLREKRDEIRSRGIEKSAAGFLGNVRTCIEKIKEWITLPE